MKNTNYMRDLMLTVTHSALTPGQAKLSSKKRRQIQTSFWKLPSLTKVTMNAARKSSPSSKKPTSCILFLQKNPRNDAYLDRNKYMVDKSDFVVAIFDDSDPHTGGTWHTLDYAMRKGKIVIKIQWQDIR